MHGAKRRQKARPPDAAGSTGDLFAPAVSSSPAALARAPAVVPAVVPAVFPVRSRAPRQLWLALRFTGLSLVAASPASRRAAPGAAVVVVDAGTPTLVTAVNAAASRAGIHPGLKLAAAHALAPGLEVLEQQPAEEARELQRLARWAIGLTPFVSLEPPDQLLLEVQGSLSLFGGTAALIERARAGLNAEGHAVALALAPTPRAAIWFARAAPGTVIDSPARLAGELARLPLGAMAWSARTLEDTARLGLTTLGELKRLPRDGLARRFEAAVLTELDEAYGQRAAPRRRYQVPERFRSRADLPAELTGTGELTPYCERLLDELGEFLKERNAGIARLAFVLAHRDQKPTCLVIGRAVPAGDVAGWRGLLGERLMRELLPAPVQTITLRTGALLPLEGTSGALPGLAAREAEGAALALLDRLRARLGENAVSGVCLVPEHRPEVAWRTVRPEAEPVRAAATATPLALPEAARPLWLLGAPEPLAVRAGRPRHGGALKLESGPERIESGWWDGGEVRRDYYVARSERGARLWIFRERTTRAWFVHGVFG